MKNYKISAKRADNGKWWSYGNIKENQWGNLSLGIRITPEFLALLEGKEEGQWINFSLFDDDKNKDNPHNQQKADECEPQGNTDMNDDIPF